MSCCKTVITMKYYGRFDRVTGELVYDLHESTHRFVKNDVLSTLWLRSR